LVVNLVLASNSPRRRQLLSLGGWHFRVLPVDVDESPLPGEEPLDYVLRLATSKGQAAAGQVFPTADAAEDVIVVAADTTVVDGKTILGKPADEVEAERMLRALRGRVHQVYTALAVLRCSDGLMQTDWCATDVPMRDYSDAEMLAYIRSGDPLDKAGAYAIQHLGFHPVENLQGCFANVMGLPLCHLARTLNQVCALPHLGIAQACQKEIKYACPIYQQVLQGAI
jgi:MAF protein